ncbi:disease resistance protein RPP13 [Brachypodium distachyon]|uniref:NB-ARC domain-containing protein n=1 Tax=Brachypodium distachyon TaxID=15368 RepID=I1IMG2_BRADI|nr:disease resistance protein RPP13 [Brachypodium distachyon]KQJ88888.1 hypothetical protein BRADI_4g21950v3 [Brachypodium distachyon]KQJ88889.1 hypothetical protein BRADI_4g21950v3 [Brachypodium distachyon]KQJ88890.1 hypothetical protein BRADI_4g21950v3 [Brachypodium distachyon]KQJ88891.1 hypothetical protein BRADI_4g21950v3 [Brachypodium distachyon]PNT63873.1 hypothetical protein BRADI_4g21950v3 [Brachypodium distachyon]|eukprot:XP_003576148.1 disease resistance protein RPP13 [Brachypodium distachyon]
MADLVVGLAKSVVEGALTKAQSAIEEEAKLRQSAQRDLVFITGEFQMMQSFLNVADAERLGNPVVRTWVRQIRELAYDVEDCVEFVVHLDKRSLWWRRLLPPSFLPRAAASQLDEAVGELEHLKARVEDVSARNARYSLISDSGSKPAKKPKASAAAAAGGGGAAAAFSLLIEARDASKRQQGIGDLTQFLTKKDDGLELQVISVWGTAGDLGAASLIRKAYNDPEIHPAFKRRAWVKIMHPFDPLQFIRSLMAQFHANSCKQPDAIIGVEVLRKMDSSQDQLLKEFEEQVKTMKYLVVLEDVCTIAEWDTIRSFLPDRNNGSWIIVSTQQFEIASLCIGHAYQVLELKQFSSKHSVCAFFKEGSQEDDDQVDETDMACTSNNEISVSHELSKAGGSCDLSKAGGSCDLSFYTKILSSKSKAAEGWMKSLPLVGRELQMNKLHACAAKARFEAWNVMSVWGIAGVGKSALVKNFYCQNMCQKDQLFNKYSWVEVTQPFNLRDFCRSLLWDFRSESLQAKDTAYHGAMSSKNPIHECCKLLKKYQCLVVIDDLRSTEDWDLIKSELVSRHSKSVIVVITSEAKIATHCADNEELVLNVKGLEADAAFDLFEMEVHRNNKTCPLNSKDKELKELILKCGGLPKVIVAIARLLAAKTVTLMETASSLNLRFMHELENNPEFDSLRGLLVWMQSYFRDCQDFLKPCIFYLSIFPLDHRIRRRRLVRRWIAEGYARDCDKKSAEDNGEDYFSSLLDLSIIQQPPQSVTTNLNDTRMALCQVNGFVREYIVSRRMEENLVFELGGSCCLTTQRTGRHLIILESWDRDMIVFNSIDFSRLRSMTVFGEWKSFFISDTMKILRVLDLENAKDVLDDDLHRIVKLLPRLKSLSIRGCHEISHLPSSVGDLRQLQSLDVRHTSIVSLPSNITNLEKLQYIRAGNTTTSEEPSTPCLPVSMLSKLCRPGHQVGVEVPGGIGKLTALHTLGVVNISASGGKAILKELKKLTQLRKLGVSGINRKNRDEFRSAISSHSHLESLSVWLDKDSENCLDGISLPLKNVQSLKLYGLVDKLPGGIKQDSQDALKEVKLTKLELEMDKLSKDDIAVLGALPKLCTLRVKQFKEGTLDFCVKQEGRELRTYQKVRILEIACSSSLKVNFGSETMQNLEQLKVDCCNGSSLKFSDLNKLAELKEVVLKGCSDNKLKEDLQTQLLQHTKKPLLKLE